MLLTGSAGRRASLKQARDKGAVGTSLLRRFYVDHTAPAAPYVSQDPVPVDRQRKLNYLLPMMGGLVSPSHFPIITDMSSSKRPVR